MWVQGGTPGDGEARTGRAAVGGWFAGFEVGHVGLSALQGECQLPTPSAGVPPPTALLPEPPSGHYGFAPRGRSRRRTRRVDGARRRQPSLMCAVTARQSAESKTLEHQGVGGGVGVLVPAPCLTDPLPPAT